MAGGGEQPLASRMCVTNSYSTITGLLVPVLFHPLNQLASKRYYGAQEGIMMARDKKTHIITEALHGIRQIKFSAIESQWQSNIMAARSQELIVQRSLFIWAGFLIFCWLSMPIILGAAALGMYALLHETMTASVAFTALSVFASLEWTLGVIPNTITEFFDARISIDRIQQYLDVPDKELSTLPGDAVAFEKASITWPANEHGEVGFALHGLTLEFPPNKFRYDLYPKSIHV